MLFQHKRTKFKIFVQEKADKNAWDPIKQRIKRNYAGYTEINRNIDHIEANIRKVVRDAIFNSIDPLAIETHYRIRTIRLSFHLTLRMVLTFRYPPGQSRVSLNACHLCTFQKQIVPSHSTESQSANRFTKVTVPCANVFNVKSIPKSYPDGTIH